MTGARRFGLCGASHETMVQNSALTAYVGLDAFRAPCGDGPSGPVARNVIGRAYPWSSLWPLVSFCREILLSRRCLAPKGRPEISPGREPGVRRQNNRALKGRHKSQVAQGFCAAPSGLDVSVMNPPGLTPGAIFSRPLGPQKPLQANFATETNYLMFAAYRLLLFHKHMAAPNRNRSSRPHPLPTAYCLLFSPLPRLSWEPWRRGS